MKKVCTLAIFLLAALLATVQTADAQMTIGANGAFPQPYSPNCVAPLVWTMTNGHYSCQNPPPPPPPTCPNGYTETSAPVWNGVSWSAPGCLATVRRIPPTDLINACIPSLTALLNSTFPGDSFSTWLGGSWSTGPYAGNANLAFGEFQPGATPIAVSGNFVLTPMQNMSLSMFPPNDQVVEAESIDARSDTVTAFWCVIDPGTGSIYKTTGLSNNVFVNEGGG